MNKQVSNCCGDKVEYKEHYYDNHKGTFVCKGCEKPCVMIEETDYKAKYTGRYTTNKGGLYLHQDDVEKMMKKEEEKVVGLVEHIMTYSTLDMRQMKEVTEILGKPLMMRLMKELENKLIKKGVK